METNKLLSIAITLTVGIILLGALLVPVISDAAITDAYGENEYTTRANLIGTDAVSLSYNGSIPLFNGEPAEFKNSSGNNSSFVAIVADSFLIMTYGGQWYYYLVDETSGSPVQIYSTATGASTAVGTIESGQMSVTINESTTYTASYSFCYIPNDSGKFALCASPVNAIVSKSAPVAVFDPTRLSCGVASGNIDELVTGFHITNSVLDSESYLFTATYDNFEAGIDTLAKTSGTFGYIVPFEYKYSEVGSYSALFRAIPVMVVLALLITATSAVYLNRQK